MSWESFGGKQKVAYNAVCDNLQVGWNGISRVALHGRFKPVFELLDHTVFDGIRRRPKQLVSPCTDFSSPASAACVTAHVRRVFVLMESSSEYSYPRRSTRGENSS